MGVPWEAYQQQDEIADAPKPWERYAKVSLPVDQIPEKPREGSGVWDSIVAGYQSSATGLLARGKLPDVYLDPHHAKWYEKALSGASSVVSDLPEAIAGGIGGSAAGSVVGPLGSLLGGGAGMMAVPAEIREALTRAYESGEADSSTTFLQRTGIIIKGLGDAEVLKATRNAALVGAATLGAGRFAQPLGALAKFGAEVGTMAVAPAALEGKLPEPEDFVNAAILVGGMKAAGHIAGKIANVYAKTGIDPEQVVANAKSDPTIKEDLLAGTPTKEELLAEQPQKELGLSADEIATSRARLDATIAAKHAELGIEIPRAYQPAAAAEAAKQAIPEPSEAAKSFVESPFAEVPQKPGEPKVPLHPNYDYINSTEDVKAALARASQLYGDKIEQQTRGKVSWQQTEQEGAARLAEMVGAKDTSLLADRQPGTGAGATEMYLRGQLMLGAVEDFTRKAQAYDPLKASPEDAIKMQAAAERVGMLSAMFQGASAEAGRALNALKMVNAGLRQAEAINKLMEGAPDPAKVAQVMQGVDNPVAAAKVAREVLQPKALSTNQKLLQVRNFALLLGFKVPQVKAIGDSIAWASGIIDRVVAAGVGMVTPGSEKVTMSEVGAFISGTFAGTRNALRVGAETWKWTGIPRDEANAFGYRPVFGEGAKAGEPSQPPEPGSKAELANKIVAIPHRIIGAETEFARELNKSGEARALAVRQAITEKLTPGTDSFNSRIREIEQNPTPERQAQIDRAGAEATFTAELGTYGKALQALARTPIGGYIIPFTTVPANLVKWAVARIPGAAFALDEVKVDFAEGGARRDIAIARQVVGATVAAAAYGAVKGGILTGGGMGLTPQEREARRDAGIQDYSIKLGETYYGFNRFEPIARIASLAADVAEISEKMEKDDKANLPAMLGFMFGHALVSQTYLSGLNDFLKALDDPTREAPKIWDNFVGSWVPAIFAQTAAAMDKDTRRVDGAFDAVRNRLPFLREGLLPRINPLTGEPSDNKSNLTPVDVTDISQDPVLKEAARLGVGIGKAPKSIQLPSGLDKREGKIELTPKQQNLFTSTSGQLAHNILSQIVGTDRWNSASDMVKMQIYKKVFAQARQAGAAAALPGEERAALAQGIADKIAGKLNAE